MARIAWSAIAACVATTALPLAAHAQRASYLGSLATPPEAVGSCSPAPAPGQLRADAPVIGLAGRQLEIVADGSPSRRTLMVYTDRLGRPRQYAETSGPSAGKQARVSAEVEATVDSAGHVRGFLLQHTTPAQGAVRHTRRALTIGEQRKVRVLSGWLVNRCPA